MKKIVLGISMSLVALAFLVPPAAAARPSHGAPALSDFLASLAPAPELAAKRPAIGQKSYCSATANCASGTVSCTGNSSCTAVDSNCPSEQGHVTCDGVTTSCSPCGGGSCGDPYFCTNAEADCAAGCAPCSYFFSCNDSTCHFHCGCGIGGCPQ